MCENSEYRIVPQEAIYWESRLEADRLVDTDVFIEAHCLKRLVPRRTTLFYELLCLGMWS